MRDLAGTLLDGKYRLVRLIGRGGMGGVYEAEHVAIGRRVAVKLIVPELVGRAEAEERFRLEARAAGRLYHPNVIEVTDYGVTPVDGVATAYLVMEYARGTTLREVLREKNRLPIPIAVDVVEQIAAALRAAHDAGILHRDLKPDNVALIPDARGGYAVKVLDFGIAALLDENAPPVPVGAGSGRAAPPGEEDEGATVIREADATILQEESAPQRLTSAGALVGTPAYMSPEQLRGERIDPRSDVYALALIAFEMLAGRQPFQGSRPDVMAKHLAEPPPPVSAFRSVPQAMVTVLARSLEKDPEARHPTATAFAGSFAAAAEGASTVLRRAISVYSDRFETLFPFAMRQLRAVAIGSVAFPVVVLVVLALMPSPQEARSPVHLWFFGAVLAAVLVLFSWAAITSHASFAFAMRTLRERPLSTIDAAEVDREINAIVGLGPEAGALRRSLRLLPFYVRCELRAPAGRGDLAFQIAAMERLEPRAAAARTAILAAPVARAYSWVGMSLLLALLLLPNVEAMLVYGLLDDLRVPFELGVAKYLGGALLPLNSVLILPVFSIAFSLLYVHARKANGEDVTSP